MAYKLKLKPNRTYRKRMTWKAGGVPVNATGKTLCFRIKEKKADGDLLTMTTDGDSDSEYGSTIEWIDRANGVFEVLITDEETEAFDTATINGGQYSFSEIMANGDDIPKGEGLIEFK